MAFCGRGWSERALDPDPHDLLIRGWAALDTERNQHYRTLQTMVIVGRIALPLGAWTEGCRLACYPPAQSARAQPAPAGAARQAARILILYKKGRCESLSINQPAGP